MLSLPKKNSLILTLLLLCSLASPNLSYVWPVASNDDLDSITTPLNLDTAGIEELQFLLTSGHTSSVDLVTAYVQRMQEVNHVLHAISEVNPDAIKIACVRDEERSQGRLRGPLHGIPVLLKDNIATCDGLNTTAGSTALIGARPIREAPIVRRLRSSGAIILGKTTMGQWAQFRSSIGSSSHGWSAYGGQAVGAYHEQQDPHGSSSGSAVAVSIGLSPVALSTETSGSIVNPAETNNLVGIKPTLGLTSRRMIIPISKRQDSVGPVAHTVKDAAHVLTVIAGKDVEDNYTLAQPFATPLNYAKACRFSAARGSRIGIPRNAIRYHETTINAPIMHSFEQALRLLGSAGAEIVDEANFERYDVDAFSRNSSIVLDTDFVSGLSEYLAGLGHNPNGIHNLEDLISYTKSAEREGFPDRDIYVWERAIARGFNSTSDISRAAYQANLDMAETFGIVGALDRYDLDALVMPTFAAFHLPAVAGLPIVTVPLGYMPADTPVTLNAKGTMVAMAPGTPFGISFVGRRWSEGTLIGLAYAFEQRTLNRHLRKPMILPKSQLPDATQQLRTDTQEISSWQTQFRKVAGQVRSFLLQSLKLGLLEVTL